MTRPLILFSFFIVTVAFTFVIFNQVRGMTELRELIKDLPSIAAHPLRFASMIIIVIVLFNFKLRNSTTLLCLFSIFLISLYVKVGKLTGELRDAMLNIATHPVQFGITMIPVIILFSFEMSRSTALLCLFSFYFISLYVKVGELTCELREAVSYIFAHPILFGMLVLFKINLIIFNMWKKMDPKPLFATCTESCMEDEKSTCTSCKEDENCTE